MLKLIIYASEYTGEDRDLTSDLRKIRVYAKHNNPLRQITGVLFYENRHFLQAIEGPQSEIDRLMDSLRNDSRHCNLEVLVELDIEERYFSDWNMDTVNLDKAKLFTTETLKKLRDAYMKNIKLTDASFVTLIQDMLNTTGAEEILNC